MISLILLRNKVMDARRLDLEFTIGNGYGIWI